MRVALLSAGHSIHTVRWANGLSAAGAKVVLLTQGDVEEPLDGDIDVVRLRRTGPKGYFLNAPQVKSTLRALSPDVLNCHYASGYGTTAKLAGFKPFVLSVWGSDVYDFPARSPAHRWLIRQNIMSADVVTSTSHCMAAQVMRLAPRLERVEVIPFGVEVDRFGAASSDLSGRSPDKPIVIGTVKTLMEKYGIDTLIRAFHVAHQRVAKQDSRLAERLRLRIVGGGPQRSLLEGLVASLDLRSRVEFVGAVPHGLVPSQLEKLDIYVALSRSDSESFGVAVIEAGAAARPVVVSDAGGLPEVVMDGETGFVVPREQPEAAASALVRLIYDGELRARLGAKGQEHVRKHFDWKVCVNDMIKVFELAISGRREREESRK